MLASSRVSRSRCFESLVCSIRERSSLRIVFRGGGAVSGVGDGCAVCPSTAGAYKAPTSNKFVNRISRIVWELMPGDLGFSFDTLSQLNLFAERRKSEVHFIDFELIFFWIRTRQESFIG